MTLDDIKGVLVVGAGSMGSQIAMQAVILRKELPGFLVNRILRAQAREAYYLLEEGVAATGPPKALEARVKRGQLGRKTGRGFYDWSTTPPTPTTD
jgi:3-hydroxyacyl-CoA dehydrogenase